MKIKEFQEAIAKELNTLDELVQGGCKAFAEDSREVYKESEFGLNFNTVTDSNTMFARRVFELMASNTVVLSNYSKGVYRLFKDNVLYMGEMDLAGIEISIR